MDSPILFLLIPLFIAATATGVWFGTKPIRDLRRDPDLADQWKLPFRERWRYGKLARSEEPITDPEEARKAERAARLTVRITEGTFRKHHLAFLVLGLMSIGLRLRGDIDLRDILFAIGAPVLLVIGYLANRRAIHQMRRTAELNGWDLDR